MQNEDFKALVYEALTEGFIVPCTLKGVDVESLCVARNDYYIPLFVIVDADLLEYLKPRNHNLEEMH